MNMKRNDPYAVKEGGEIKDLLLIKFELPTMVQFNFYQILNS